MKFILIIISISIILSCQTKKKAAEEKLQVIIESNKREADSLVSLEDSLFEKQSENPYKEEAGNYALNLKKQFDTLPTPLIVKYNGNMLNDHFSLEFEDSLGNIYDFGDSNNSFGKYTLYSGDQYNDNPELLVKWFKLYWEYKLSTFPWCGGDYYQQKEILPSISNLELIE